ncbi:hypothetical protein MF406_03155 [Georgenia sp. TF02-10]|uniref:hypothetical protein n=1 Tax=Georgenia sp. TF02-10 TaxID=2917725 RepID=UPI001FA80B55|nr:hypothetical protein [Georgenia sp. TF02-10]UNX55285.1 hypothetical protein MF406_03155 [Georgenia sp. TF02-10]
MRTPGWHRWPGLTLAALLGVPVVLAAAGGLLSLHRCLPADGAWATVAVRLALLRPDGVCPPGTLAVGAGPDQALAVVVAVTVPTLVLHLLMATGVAGLAGTARAALAVLARRLVPRPPAEPVTDLPTPAPTLAPPRAVLPRTRPLLRQPHRRGPPVAATG